MSDEFSEQIVDELQAQRLVRDYVCAGCYGHLVTQFTKRGRDLRLVSCPACGDGRGFVTKRFADRQRSDSIEQAFVARKNLERAMPALRRKEQSEADLLSGLGF